MDIISHATSASVRAIESLAFVPAAGFLFACAFTSRGVVVTAVLALALEVLRSENRNVVEHFTAASLPALAVDLPCFNVISEMIFESVTAKALRRGTNGFAILACLHVSPVHIKTILAGFSNLGFVRFELGLAHHLTVVGIAHNLFILNISLNVFGGLAVHY